MKYLTIMSHMYAVADAYKETITALGAQKKK